MLRVQLINSQNLEIPKRLDKWLGLVLITMKPVLSRPTLYQGVLVLIARILILVAVRLFTAVTAGRKAATGGSVLVAKSLIKIASKDVVKMIMRTSLMETKAMLSHLMKRETDPISLGEILLPRKRRSKRANRRRAQVLVKLQISTVCDLLEL